MRVQMIMLRLEIRYLGRVESDRTNFVAFGGIGVNMKSLTSAGGYSFGGVSRGLDRSSFSRNTMKEVS